MNNIVIKGRLTADPEMRKTMNGVPVANFTVAVDRTFNRDETDFFRCTAWIVKYFTDWRVAQKDCIYLCIIPYCNFGGDMLYYNCKGDKGQARKQSPVS